MFIDFPAVKTVEETGILGDILSHTEKTKDYPNLITKTHENAHFANNAVNRKYAKPGFYLLNNKAMVLDRELPLTINQIAKQVPQSLRWHQSYDWYLVKLPAINPVNNQLSSVIFDEWVAYHHGCRYKIETNNNDEQEDIEQMLAFTVYSVVALMSHDYDQSTLDFVKYQIHETGKCYKNCEKLNRDAAETYLDKFLNSPDTLNIRNYMKKELEFEFSVR